MVNMDEWKEVKDDIWNPDVDSKTLIGRIVEVRGGIFGVPQYKVVTQSGKSYWTPSHKELAGKMALVDVSRLPVDIWISAGEKKSGKYPNPLQKYQVFTKK